MGRRRGTLQCALAVRIAVIDEVLSRDQTVVETVVAAVIASLSTSVVDALSVGGGALLFVVSIVGDALVVSAVRIFLLQMVLTVDPAVGAYP